MRKSFNFNFDNQAFPLSIIKIQHIHDLSGTSAKDNEF